MKYLIQNQQNNMDTHTQCMHTQHWRGMKGGRTRGARWIRLHTKKREKIGGGCLGVQTPIDNTAVHHKHQQDIDSDRYQFGIQLLARMNQVYRARVSVHHTHRGPYLPHQCTQKTYVSHDYVESHKNIIDPTWTLWTKGWWKRCPD